VSFKLIYEVSLPREPDLKKIFTQLEIFGPVVDSFLIPDNHLGIAAVSSVAVAIEVKKEGLDPLVALNARDRNTLRLESDLLTLKSYDINKVLFLYGDHVDVDRSSLNVKKMLAHPAAEGMKMGVAARIGQSIGWRARADFLFTQLAFGVGKPGYWREAEGFDNPMFCGVIAPPNRRAAEFAIGNIPNLTPPGGYFERFDSSDEAGLEAAVEEITHLRSVGVDGAHLVVPAKWRRCAEILGAWRA
jgi:5,10-methylenetetrahydrofolate reductase